MSGSTVCDTTTMMSTISTIGNTFLGFAICPASVPMLKKPHLQRVKHEHVGSTAHHIHSEKDSSWPRLRGTMQKPFSSDQSSVVMVRFWRLGS